MSEKNRLERAPGPAGFGRRPLALRGLWPRAPRVRAHHPTEEVIAFPREPRAPGPQAFPDKSPSP